MINLEEEKEKVILVAVARPEDGDVTASLKELESLVETDGAICCGSIVQNREDVHPGTYVGKGKIEEIRQLAEYYGANGIVCDDELSPAQLRNLSDVLALKILDRTQIILDIFATRAVTSEGKLQVELAQLKYRQARLVGLGKSLSRQGGGIGSKGPGEKKLEMDRRLIKNRMAALRKDLQEVEKHRDLAREQRGRTPIPQVAIVGYTNAGKSTLLNTLTGAGVLSENRLFATLDPTTRILDLPDGSSVLLTDTVGFIRKLPHQLIEAFKSTLEEACYADILIHVVDATSPEMAREMAVSYDLLSDLGAMGKPVITVFNKVDRLNNMPEGIKDGRADKKVFLSARYGGGLEGLFEALEDLIRELKTAFEGVFPYSAAGEIQSIYKYGTVLEEEYREDGIFVKALLPREMAGRLCGICQKA